MVGAELEEAIREIRAGTGTVTIDDLLKALSESKGIVSFFHRIKLWDHLNDEQHKELDMLDDIKPDMFWHLIQTTAPPALFKGYALKWKHGTREHANAGFTAGVEGNDYVVRTPTLADISLVY